MFIVITFEISIVAYFYYQPLSIQLCYKKEYCSENTCKVILCDGMEGRTFILCREFEMSDILYIGTFRIKERESILM